MDAAAHSRNARGVRHALADHLRGVADRAAAFARGFGAEDLARLAGLYHDLGKFHPEFQHYLDYCEQHPGKRGPRVDHKAAGATLAATRSPLLPLVIMAHHGGLKTSADLQAWLNDDIITPRIKPTLDLARAALPELRAPPSLIPPPSMITAQSDAEMFVRMVFSCLVDADFLDTEEHFDGDRTAARATEFDPAHMADQLRAFRASLNSGPPGPMSDLRRSVVRACEDAGARPPGIYRMTVPTGGGKTLAGMAFALRHAAAHLRRRVIVAIPYTSITEQTAAVYREIFGDRAVLEHHSGARLPEHDDDEPTQEHLWQRLAAENWDAPIVVTTMVQLFESLFGNRVSTSRKLHNLSEAVVILDEVQMVPPKFVAPILDVLRGLVEHYGTTVLLSTATQPEYVHPAFRDLPEIAPDPPALFAHLRRVEYVFDDRPWSWDDAAGALGARPQAMMVLNTKRDARAVLKALDDAGALHLSTNLCGAHRRDVLAEVRRRLLDGKPCRLVTTQVVEAGVDLDFPAVFRAMGPLDRIIQAAGRCNREGRPERGQVTVFTPAAGGLPQGAYRTATQIFQKLRHRGQLDLHDPAVPGAYFAELYDTVDTDAESIQKLRARMDFPEVAHRLRLIDNDTDDVIVPYGAAQALDMVRAAIDALKSKQGRARELMRRIHPYTVSLRSRDITRAASRGLAAPVLDGVWEWTGPAAHYDPIQGLIVDGIDAELLIG